MSDRVPRLRRDAGMTLPEVMIAMVVIGVIATVIAASILVTFRTRAGTEGRLNVASAEQSISVWLPADLSSAVGDPDVDAAASPCGAPVCDGITLDGSNALMLSWPSGGSTVYVSYIYRMSSDGETYELVRLLCDAGVCTRNVVLRDLAGPPPGWRPRIDPVPSAVINVAVPLAADAVDEGSTDATSTARRIVVTIDGGGGSEGAGGGINRVSITAGGTQLSTLEADKVTGPSFLQAKSRCGGPVTVIVDDSGSIASAGGATDVENAVVGFAQALAGTPTQLQIIKFSAKSRLIDHSSAWNKYYDMSDPTVVSTLEPLIRTNLVQSGGTNWEDAIFRTFYADTTSLGADGRLITLGNDGNPATHIPKLVVFFTDGEPTLNRAYEGSSSLSSSDITSGGLRQPPAYNTNKWPLATGNTFDQEGWDRAKYMIDPFLHGNQGVRVIGVGVGGIASGSVYSFTEETVNTIRNGSGRQRGIIYSSGNAYTRNNNPSGTLPNNGGGTSTLLSANTTREKVFGNLLVGVHPTLAAAYNKATYSGGAWQNFNAETNLMITSQFSAIGPALTQIALGECGGTVTLQTKKSDGTNATADVTYEAQVGPEVQQITTSQINRAAAVDMTFPAGVTQVSTTIVPRAVAGYTATGWSCKSRGVNLPAGRWSVIGGDPAKGIQLTVNANEAIACTMTVSGS